MFEAFAPQCFADFERRITAACAAAPGPTLSVRAASLARQGGACDVIITAALVHDYASSVESIHAAKDAVLSAHLLREVFEDVILRLLLELPAARTLATPPASQPRAYQQCARLARYLATAQDATDPVLPLPRLLTVAKRMSRDAY